MSTGFENTRLISRLMIRASSGSQSRTFGSAVAMTASFAVTDTGRVRKRGAYGEDMISVTPVKNATGRGVRRGHDLGPPGEVDLERIDVQVVQPQPLGEPLRQNVEGER